ncbi:unnamed protein product [Anisakis simplex]|uniref:Uncharacterized protein n=1 Tax=Anisakis simplex TaxID=6269 RepID=A0A3P6P8R4_ANISI|nr:unnamed protein product [Anisakis simplex]
MTIWKHLEATQEDWAALRRLLELYAVETGTGGGHSEVERELVSIARGQLNEFDKIVDKI